MYELKFTKKGHNFFDMASMLQKSIRRCDVKNAAYAAYELFGNYNRYLWKRLIVISAEDCYGPITKEIIALREAEKISSGSKKGYDRDAIFVSKAVVILCRALKNRDACYVACNFMGDFHKIPEEEIEAISEEELLAIQAEYNEVTLTNRDIPNYVYDVHTRLGKIRGETLVDMIDREQRNLHPKQRGLFDDGDWSQFMDARIAKDEVSSSEYKKYLSFKADKKTY